MTRADFAVLVDDVLDLLPAALPSCRNLRADAHHGTHMHPDLIPTHAAVLAAERAEKYAQLEGLDDPRDPYAFGKLDRLRVALRRAWDLGVIATADRFDVAVWCRDCGTATPAPGPLCIGCDRERAGMPRNRP